MLSHTRNTNALFNDIIMNITVTSHITKELQISLLLDYI